MPNRQEAEILLGKADAESYGYKRPLRVYAHIALTRQSDYGSAPREFETTDRRTVVDPLELSVTFSVRKTWATGNADPWVACGAMGEKGLREVAVRSCSSETWERVKRLLPWHMNAMTAGCVHQIADGWDKRPIDPSKPTRAYGRHFPGQRQDSWNLLGWVRETDHPDGLMCRECPECGYRYGSSWLVRELPADIIADAVALGAVVPPDRTDPAVIMAEGATDGR